MCNGKKGRQSKLTPFKLLGFQERLVLITQAEEVLTARMTVVEQEILTGIALGRIVLVIAIIMLVSQVETFQNPSQVLAHLIGNLRIDIACCGLALEVGP